jgi:hypothetical protein
LWFESLAVDRPTFALSASAEISVFVSFVILPYCDDFYHHCGFLPSISGIIARLKTMLVSTSGHTVPNRKSRPPRAALAVNNPTDVGESFLQAAVERLAGRAHSGSAAIAE